MSKFYVTNGLILHLAYTVKGGLCHKGVVTYIDNKIIREKEETPKKR